ncbi:substrate-binding domain-containing protein [Actinopolymorpha sp. B11F2]|uniref:substrate-binding domain-containing protein n=1 Tax=Actinopolymorpha sp. B11F2 TaxID=3160862 RepID=UPI0032E4B66E
MVSRRQFLSGAAVLATVTVAGCAGKDDGAGGGDGAVSFTYLRPTWGPATYTKDGPFEKALEKQGKADIDVQIIPVIDYDTKVNTILASGDIPDVIWGSGPSSATWKEAQDEGAFLPIDDYLEQYPALREAVPESIWEILKDENGDTYFIPNLIWPQVPFFLCYREDLFEKAGIEPPTTVDEFAPTVAKVKSAFPEQVPFTMGYEWSAKEIATSFGVSMFSWEPSPADPDLLIPWYMKEPEVDMYFWFQDLHKRGLLDPDYGVNKEPNFADDKFKAGKSVMVISHWSSIPDATTQLRTIDKYAKVGVVSPLGELGGNRLVFPVDRGFYVSGTMEDPDGFFRFLNWTLTDGSELRRWGIRDKTFTVSEDGKEPIPDNEREKAFQGPQLEPMGFLGPFSEKLDWDITKLAFEAAKIPDRFDYVKGKFDEYCAQEYPDYRDPTVRSAVEDKKGTQLYEDYLQKVAQSTIINHDVSRDDWRKAVDKWRAAGGDQIIDEINTAQKDKSKPSYIPR